MPPLSLPERTLEAWVSIVVARRFPNARIWAPTAASTDDWDVAADVAGDGKVFVLENKGCAPSEANFRPPRTRPADHLIRIDMQQLRAYVGNRRLAPLTYYVLPVPPWSGVPSRPRWPFERDAPTPPIILPGEAGARRGCERWIRVVAARELEALLSTGRPADHRTVHSDQVLAVGVTLDVFLRRVRRCEIGWPVGSLRVPAQMPIDVVAGFGEFEDGPGTSLPPHDRPALAEAEQRGTEKWRGQSSTAAVFVPISDLTRKPRSAAAAPKRR